MLARIDRHLPRPAVAVAAASTALLLALSGRYGFHRDELYFLAAGRRLDWGFVDQPPLTPLVARISELVGGTSPTSLRVLPALAVGGIALLAAATARAFGGGRRAQVYAAAALGGAGVVLGEGHLLSTAIFDFFLWTLALWILVKLLTGADPRWWLALGAAIGVGMQNKYTMGFFAVALLVSLAVTSRRSLLASRWPWLGAGIALIIALPNLVWQAANGWPQLELADALRDRSDGALAFVLLQPALLSIVLTVPAAIGLWWLARAEAARPWRPIAVMYVVLFVFFLVTGGKAYYVAPMYSALLAAGALWFDQLGRGTRRWVAGLTAAGILAGMLIALPIVPPGSVSSFDATGELGETVGWPQLVDQVERVYEGLPPDMRRDAVLLTASYGEAGALEILGAQEGLPAAYSGHNNYWLWGPPAQHGAVIGVGPVGATLGLICPDIARVGTISNPYGVDNEESGLPLLLCAEPRGRLKDVWDEARHYN